ncbi:MAG TPA: EamA family transporter [Anaerolineales bacterium]|jgi:drug/metabolite transporter (DMT)-like permease
MNRILGISLIAISAASFGTLAVFGRYAYANGIDKYTLLFLRFGISAILMSILLFLRHETIPRGKTLWQLVAMGAIGYVGQSFSYLTAIQYASAGLVALLLYLYPIFVALLSSLILKEKITRIKALALGIALAGTALTVSPEGGQLPGILLALSAATIYSFYIILGSHVMQKVSAIQSSTVIFASAGLVYGLLTAINGPHMPSGPVGWWIIIGTIIIATIIPVVTFLAGMQRIGPTNASMLSTLEPVVTVILAAVLFQEALQPVTLLGGGMILASVILVTRSELRQAV